MSQNLSVFISIISHNHGDMINHLSCVEELSKHFNVVVKSNTGNDCFDRKISGGFHWINDNYNIGFSENNNRVYSYCKQKLGMQDDDVFIVMNPDVVIYKSEIDSLVDKMSINSDSFSAINLYRNVNTTEFDYSIRCFPGFLDFFCSFLGFNNRTIIDKSIVTEPKVVDWASGAFLAFKSLDFERVGGFDERYFMYCEDIDICYRLKKEKCSLIYYPDIKAVHFAKHKNRDIFSRHFIWHLRSVFIFLFKKKFNLKAKTSIVGRGGYYL